MKQGRAQESFCPRLIQRALNRRLSHGHVATGAEMSALFPPPFLIVRTIDCWLVQRGQSQEICRLREQLARFFISRMRKVVVPQTHGVERIWRRSGYTDYAVGQVIVRFISGSRPTGTAMMMRAGWCSRTAAQATRIIEPV